MEAEQEKISTASPRTAAMRRAEAAAYVPIGLDEGIASLASVSPFAEILATAGAPRFRRRRGGFAGLLHTILGQQVSVEAAAAMFLRLSEVCRPLAPTPFLALDETALRACGFSRQKMGYARDLATRLDEGRFDFTRIEEAPDEAALQALLALKGVGRWSAEIYLLFCLGRADIWPAADLGLQIAVGESLGLAERPGERALRALGEAWRPWRSVAACLFWQSYLHTRGRQPRPLPAALCAGGESLE